MSLTCASLFAARFRVSLFVADRRLQFYSFPRESSKRVPGKIL